MPDSGTGWPRRSNFPRANSGFHRHRGRHGPESQPDPHPAGPDPGTQVRPGRGTLGRWVQAAGIAAGRVLKHLDRQCRALVLVGCLDEIFFHGRPVLVGVEPASMTWFLGTRPRISRVPPGVSTCRHGPPWNTCWPTRVRAYRRASRRSSSSAATAAHPLENGLDVFHTLREGERALSQAWAQVETLWGEAEAADRRVEQARRQTGDTRAWPPPQPRPGRGGSGLHSVRGGRRGLGPGAIGVARVPSGRPVERSGLGAGRSPRPCPCCADDIGPRYAGSCRRRAR